MIPVGVLVHGGEDRTSSVENYWVACMDNNIISLRENGYNSFSGRRYSKPKTVDELIFLVEMIGYIVIDKAAFERAYWRE